jgi:hypothetical protein
VEGKIVDTTGIQVRGASALDGNRGGLTEYAINDPANQIEITNVSGINPAMTGRNASGGMGGYFVNWRGEILGGEAELP